MKRRTPGSPWSWNRPRARWWRPTCPRPSWAKLSSDWGRKYFKIFQNSSWNITKYFLREQVNSYNELDAKLALKDYAQSQNQTNSTEHGNKEQSRGSSRNGTEPESETESSRQSGVIVTTGELPDESDLLAEIKGKKYKSLKEHRNKLKPGSAKDISESDYNNN